MNSIHVVVHVCVYGGLMCICTAFNVDHLIRGLSKTESHMESHTNTQSQWLNTGFIKDEHCGLVFTSCKYFSYKINSNTLALSNWHMLIGFNLLKMVQVTHINTLNVSVRMHTRAKET